MLTFSSCPNVREREIQSVPPGRIWIQPLWPSHAPGGAKREHCILPSLTHPKHILPRPTLDSSAILPSHVSSSLLSALILNVIVMLIYFPLLFQLTQKTGQILKLNLKMKKRKKVKKRKRSKWQLLVYGTSLQERVKGRVNIFSWFLGLISTPDRASLLSPPLSLPPPSLPPSPLSLPLPPPSPLYSLDKVLEHFTQLKVNG